ncbi:MAG: hypothetical protein K0Q71_6363 [Thermomicrobiales bacterium]|nr:hypothetical protein [Thermomicrobiales bacterium]
MAILPDQFDHLRELVRRPPPAQDGVAVARWTLKRLRSAAPALASYSISGMSRLVGRAGLRQKRGRLHVHSPDPAYAAKAAAVQRALADARQHPETITLLFQDEAGIARQPSLAPTWAAIGSEPTATRSVHANTQHRLCGALDAVTGQVHWWAGDRTSVPLIRRFLTTLRQHYGPDRRLIVVWDNWLVHRHDEVRATAEAQQIELLFQGGRRGLSPAVSGGVAGAAALHRTVCGISRQFSSWRRYGRWVGVGIWFAAFIMASLDLSGRRNQVAWQVHGSQTV